MRVSFPFLHISDNRTEAALNSLLHPPAGIWCGGQAPWCWCSLCCAWRWCSTWWRRAAGCTTHTACPDPSRRRRGCGPAARRRCRPAERPWAGSAAGTTPWGGGEGAETKVSGEGEGCVWFRVENREKAMMRTDRRNESVSPNLCFTKDRFDK